MTDMNQGETSERGAHRVASIDASEFSIRDPGRCSVQR